LENIFLFDRITSLQKHSLAGRWYFSEIFDPDMRDSVEKKWKSMLGYMLTVVRLLKGWYSFNFLSQEDLEKIKSMPWLNGKIFSVLHHWCIGYNSLHNTLQNKLIWVKLLGFPIELWKKQVLMDIGNAIGKKIYVDP